MDVNGSRKSTDGTISHMHIWGAQLAGSFRFRPVVNLSFTLNLSKGRPFLVRQAHHERTCPETSESEKALLRRLCRARMFAQEGFQNDHDHHKYNHCDLRPAAGGALRRRDGYR